MAFEVPVGQVKVVFTSSNYERIEKNANIASGVVNTLALKLIPSRGVILIKQSLSWVDANRGVIMRDGINANEVVVRQDGVNIPLGHEIEGFLGWKNSDIISNDSEYPCFVQYDTPYTITIRKRITFEEAFSVDSKGDKYRNFVDRYYVAEKKGIISKSAPYITEQFKQEDFTFDSEGQRYTGPWNNLTYGH